MLENQKSDIEQQPSEFLTFITRMCAAHQWKITESDDEHAVIQFAVNETRSQTLFVFYFDNSLEFSVPSFAAFDSLENVPHLISTTLLQINAKTKMGFWCLEQIGERIVYTFMHNASMENVTEHLFGEIVSSLIQRVEEFEGLLEKMPKENNSKTD
ncbi:MAG: hypothetical protein WCG34_04660 [Leptolinea sp.]